MNSLEKILWALAGIALIVGVVLIILKNGSHVDTYSSANIKNRYGSNCEEKKWCEGASAPDSVSARSGASVLVGEKIVYYNSAYTLVYDTENDVWSVGSVVPDYQKFGTHVVYNGNLYFFGVLTSKNYVYDFTNRVWVADRTYPCVDLSQVDSKYVQCGNRLYLISRSHLLCLNLDSPKEWKIAHHKLLFGEDLLALTADSNNIYVFNQGLFKNLYFTVFNSSSGKKLEIQLPGSFPEKLGTANIAYEEGKVYIAFDYEMDTHLYVYDSDLGNFSVSDAILQKVTEASMIVSNSIVYFVGGQVSAPDGSTTATNQFTSYNLSSSSWAQLANLTFARYLPLTHFVNNALFVLGGITEISTGFDELKTVEILNLS